MSSKHIAIIGAGWTGLAAALHLVKAGHRVSVFESARQPGGRARRVEIDGKVFDNGQHLLSGAYSETLAMLAVAGVDSERALLRLPLTVEVPGRFSLRLPRLPAPLHVATGLLSAKGATLAEKKSAAAFMRRIEAERFRLAVDQSVADWLDHHGQHGALRRHLWEPLCLAGLNTPATQASAQVFANVLRDTLGGGRAATDLLIPRIDLGALFPEPAAATLQKRGGELRLSARVRSIARDGESWRIEGDGFTANADHILIASGPYHAAALLPADPSLDRLRAQIAGLAYQPIATIYQHYPTRVRLPAPLIALDAALAQWVFDRGALDPSSTVIAHVLSGHGDWENLDNAALAEALHAALATAIPKLPAAGAASVIREQRATFSCTPGLDRPPNATPLPGLWLAGDYTAGDYPATLEGALRSARAAAQAIAAA